MDTTPTAPRGTRPDGRRDLPVATAVGVALALAAFGLLFVATWAFALLIAVLLAVAVVEAGRVFASVGRRVHVDVLVVVGLLWLGATYALGAQAQWLGPPVLLAASVLRSLVARDRQDVTATIGATVLLGLWTSGLASFALLTAARPGGQVALAGVLAGAALSDIGAYAVGSRLGRHRIAPRISPHKTWEGLAGGIVAAAVGGAVVLPLLGDAWTPWTGALLAGAAGLAGFVGDLTESMIKRDLGVKDFGTVLPGHGGVLDRVDGVLFALPVGHALVVLLT
jgi:phosphatidate cytidylyltransferase